MQRAEHCKFAKNPPINRCYLLLSAQEPPKNRVCSFFSSLRTQGLIGLHSFRSCIQGRDRGRKVATYSHQPQGDDESHMLDYELYLTCFETGALAHSVFIALTCSYAYIYMCTYTPTKGFGWLEPLEAQIIIGQFLQLPNPSTDPVVLDAIYILPNLRHRYRGNRGSPAPSPPYPSPSLGFLPK